MQENDMFYMQKAVELAKKATGHTSPNPLVGCVIVKDGQIISMGFHKRAGWLHAEAEALKKIRYEAKGATLYVNIEPCDHFGKTPPCTDKIIKYGIKRVIAAMKDPNPIVNGKGIAKLRKHGIKVDVGLMQKEAQDLNKIFIKNQVKREPYIILKAGISIDGKIALADGSSKWITGEQSRLHDQLLRKQADAILVGINTIKKDNPFLDCRIDSEKKIKKIVLDTHGRISPDANIFRYSVPSDIYIITSSMHKTKAKMLEKKGVNIILSGTKRINEDFIVNSLWEKGIRSILIEGGSKVHTSFLKARYADEAYIYIANKIIGNDGIPFVGPMATKSLNRTIKIEDCETLKIGCDILIHGKFKYV